MLLFKKIHKHELVVPFFKQITVKVKIVKLYNILYIVTSGGATLCERRAFAPNNFLKFHVNL